jgi:hypothetical protein
MTPKPGKKKLVHPEFAYLIVSNRLK